MTLTSILPALLLAFCTVATAQPLASGPLEHRPQPFDVLHYDAELDLTRAPARDMRGVVDITIRWIADSGSRYFAFHLRDLTIDGAWHNGTPVTVTSVGEPSSASYHHRIDPPTVPAAGDTTTVRIAYHGAMTDERGPGTWGGVGSSDSILFAMGVGFLNNYVSTTQHWLPSYDHPSDKATFRGRFKTIGGFITASNGLVSTSTNGDTTIAEWTTAIPTATYLLTFATGRYVGLDFGSDPVPMVLYVKPADSVAARTSFRLLPRMVSGFSERFTPYPFEKVGFVSTPIGAMEHQTMVSYPTFLVRRPDTINLIAAHELAHQWFGDLVTPADFRHVWLTESFATFCESVWAEELFGFNEYLAWQESKLSRYINQIAQAEGILPLYDFPRAQPSSNYPETIYQKGALVVGMLRYEMGDTSFFSAMRDYLSTHSFGIATTEDLLRVLERHHSAPLDWFFDQWVYGKGWPEVAVRAVSEPGEGGYRRLRVEIEQTPLGEQRVYRRLAVPLFFEGASDPTVAQTRVVMLDSARQTFVLDSVPSFTALRVNRGTIMRSLLRGAASVSGIGAAPDSGAIEFFVKPNPTDGTSALTVQVRGVDDCTGLRYEFFDATGRRLGTGSTDRCELTIPTDGIASGAYVLRFRFRGIFYDVSVVVAR